MNLFNFKMPTISNMTTLTTTKQEPILRVIQSEEDNSLTTPLYVNLNADQRRHFSVMKPCDNVEELFSRCLKLFRGKIHLLLVDDDRLILKSLNALFSSPVFSVSSAESYSQAIKHLSAHTGPWHCWVLDLDLGDEHNGLDIMDMGNNSTATLILSGLGSMHLASEVIKRGAAGVYDKNPGSMDLLKRMSCTLAAAGFLFDKRQTKSTEVYSVLYGCMPADVVDWSNLSGMSERHLARICSLNIDMGPRKILSLFHSLYFLMLFGDKPERAATYLDPIVYRFYLNSLELALSDVSS